MPAQLSLHLDRLAKEISSASHVLLFSDFDGTLVPIQDRPSDCFLDPEVGRTLSALAAQDRLAVGIVSGRELEDLRSRARVDGIAYAGNHGLEIEGPGFAFREPNAVTVSESIHRLAADLALAITGVAGAWVQDKGLTASVHFRQVEPADVPLLLDIVQHIAEPLLNSHKIVLRSGKMVLEVRPAVDWNKGSAVAWLANRMSNVCEDPLLIYFGDDATDEDVFAAWPEAITVRVGENRNTMANYFTNDPKEVQDFLDWLLKLILGSRG